MPRPCPLCEATPCKLFTEGVCKSPTWQDEVMRASGLVPPEKHLPSAAEVIENLRRYFRRRFHGE